MPTQQIMRRMAITVLAVVLSLLVGCGHPSVVGKWRMSGGSAETIWEFSPNGSVLLGNVRGRYSFGDQNRIKIQTPFATTVYQMEISGDRMSLRVPDGFTLEFTRISQNKRDGT